ncbi:hypothetical protein C8J57DRAFT_1472728 [Mycena rebaudengoi]|nr:hypothetical protein C8J57DRAFT_1472728 [Mycena rebaudengoi]
MSAPEGLGPVIRDAIQSVQELSAAAFIGYGVSTTAYGISIVQVYLYFRNYPKDSIFLKLTVDSRHPLQHLQFTRPIHPYVFNFNNLFANAHIPWSWPTTINTTSLIFYGWQIWSVSRNFVVVGVIVRSRLLGVMRCRLIQVPSAPFSGGTLRLFLTAIYADLSVHLFLFPTIVSLFGHTSRSMTTTIESTGLVCDITITTSLIYYLRSRKAAGVRSTRDMIDSLIMHAMSRGIFTAVCITMLFILDVAYPIAFIGYRSISLWANYTSTHRSSPR